MEYTYALSRADLLPVSGNTPFGYYDNDLEFQTDAQKACFYVTSRLGFGSVDVELIDKQIYAAYEEAVTTYGNEVYLYKLREDYLGLEGISTEGNDISNAIVTRHPGPAIRIAESFGDVTGLGDIKTYSASVELSPSQQTYDLERIAMSSSWHLSASKIQVTRVFYEDTPAIAYQNAPFPGLGGVAAYPGSYGFYGNSYTGMGGAVWPVYFDIQRVQEIEMARNVRSSGYSFSINDNVLKVFPIPTTKGKLWLEYVDEDELINGANSIQTMSGSSVVTNATNVPSTNPIYKDINSIGKMWIMRYVLALCRDTLGHIRGKYPGAEMPRVGAMSSNDLFSDARSEKEALLSQLRDLLDMISKQKQLERNVLENESTKKLLDSIPIDSSIYIL